MQFETAIALETWLNHHGIDTTGWGTGNSKTAVDLWQEIKHGESILQGHPPERLVSVVQILIRQGDQVLIEIEQELRDGRHRSRNLPPSDKMQPGETPKETAIRCLQEELGVTPDRVRSLTKSEIKQIKRDSPSYPGLVTRYEFTIFDTVISGLPTESFWHENRVEAGLDPVMRHHWTWISRDEYFSEP